MSSMSWLLTGRCATLATTVTAFVFELSGRNPKRIKR